MRRALIVVLLALLRADAAPGERLDETARQLGDPDPRVRDRAADALKSAGAAAGKALTDVADSGDPEASRRARAILREIRHGEIEEPPPETDPPEIARYDTADRDAKMQIINQLSGGSGGPRLAAFVRLWKREDEEEFRSAMYRVMLQAPGAYAGAMVAMGDAPAAERLLEASLAEGNAASTAPSYAALCLVTGRLEEAIGRWSARLAKPDGTADTIAAAVSAKLHRAAGNAPAAVEAARVAGDPLLLEEALLDAGDWAALARAVAARPAPVAQPKHLGLLAAAQFMAGDGRALDDTVQRMRKVATTPEMLGTVAHTLMLCGRTDDGVRMLADAKQDGERFKLMVARERLDEALALVASREKDKDEAAMRLRVAGARQLDYLGERERALTMLAGIADENFGPRSTEVDALLGEAYRGLGQHDKAWEHFRAALKAEKAPRAESRFAWRVFNAGDDDGDGSHDFGGNGLWEFVQYRFPDETFDQQFDRARGVVDKTISLADLQTLVEGIPPADRGPGAADRRRAGSAGQAAYAFRLVGLPAQRMYDAGDRAGAARYLEQAAERAPEPEHALQLYLRLGDWAADARDWPKAAKWYGRAWAVDRSAPGPLYLRAWALGEAGWRLRSGELTNLAHAMPLAESWKRNLAIGMLHARRVEAPLWREISTTLRTSHPNHFAADLAQRHTAEQAVRRGDYLAAAACWERALVNVIAGYELGEPVGYLRLPHNVRRLRARGLIAKGDLEAAEREIAAARAILPGDITLAIDVVPELERRGNKARADELYNEAMRSQEAALAKYPDSANHHNNAAWLAVNCERDAEKALAHARKAVELQSKNPAYVDTLAEVQFRQGKVDEAIVTMNRCVELQPRTARHREQLERFEAAKRGERRPMPPG